MLTRAVHAAHCADTRCSPCPLCSCCCAGNECGACVGYASVGGIFYTAATVLTCMPYLATPLVGCILACINMPVRRALKAKYGIATQPECCPDCGIVTFCELCSLCQMNREMLLREPPGMVMMAQPAVIMQPMQPMQPMMMQQQQPMMMQQQQPKM